MPTVASSGREKHQEAAGLVAIKCCLDGGWVVAGGAVAGAAEARAKILPPFLSYRQYLSSFLLLLVNSTLPNIFMSLHNSRCMPFFWVICLVLIVYQKFQLSIQFNRALSTHFCSMLQVAKGIVHSKNYFLKGTCSTRYKHYLNKWNWLFTASL